MRRIEGEHTHAHATVASLLCTTKCGTPNMQNYTADNMTRTSSTTNYPDCFDWIPLSVCSSPGPSKTSYSNQIDRVYCRCPWFDLRVSDSCQGNFVGMPVWIGFFRCDEFDSIFLFFLIRLHNNDIDIDKHTLWKLSHNCARLFVRGFICLNRFRYFSHEKLQIHFFLADLSGIRANMMCNNMSNSSSFDQFNH